jgi:uncharacterized damage-inducible protein DinB
MRQRTTLVLGLLLLLSTAAFAADAAPPAAPTSGYRAEYLTALADVSSKLTELAQAMPAEKFGWRPAAGVRSVAEVYGHVAGGNYYIPTFIGVQPPAGTGQDLEKETDKGKVIASLKASFDHVRNVVLKTSDADLEKKVKMFGHDASEREVLTLLLNHMHEHLGQSIAYARMNGITPPWTAREQAAEAAKKPAKS